MRIAIVNRWSYERRAYTQKLISIDLEEISIVAIDFILQQGV